MSERSLRFCSWWTPGIRVSQYGIIEFMCTVTSRRVGCGCTVWTFTTLGECGDRPKTRCVKCTPMCASARVAPSNIVYQRYGYRSTGTGVLTTKVLLLR